MKRLVALAALALLVASGAEARSNNDGAMYQIHWIAMGTDSTWDTLTVDGDTIAVDSLGLVIGPGGDLTPGFPCEYLAWDMVKYTVNDGPCSLFCYGTDKKGYETDTGGLQSTDTLVVPFPGLNMGAQGSFVPTQGYWPQELDKLRFKPLGLIDYFIIYWPARKPIW